MNQNECFFEDFKVILFTQKWLSKPITNLDENRKNHFISDGV